MDLKWSQSHGEHHWRRHFALHNTPCPVPNSPTLTAALWLQCSLRLPPNCLLSWFSRYAVRRFITEHYPTAIAIACVSHTVYDLLRPDLYRTFIGVQPRNPGETAFYNATVLQKSSRPFVRRLFVDPLADGTSGLDYLTNVIEAAIPSRELYDRPWASNLIRLTLHGSVDLYTIAPSLVSLTHMTLTTSPQAVSVVAYTIKHNLTSLLRLTHLGLDLDDNIHLGTSAICNNAASMAFGALKVLLGFPLVPTLNRTRLRCVAVRVPAIHTPLYIDHLLPRLRKLVEDGMNEGLEAGERLWIWHDSRMFNGFVQKNTALRRDFLAETDLWSEAVPLNTIIAELNSR